MLAMNLPDFKRPNTSCGTHLGEKMSLCRHLETSTGQLLRICTIPGFITQNPHNGETADPTNPCIGLIMANTFVKGKTLTYDHLCASWNYRWFGVLSWTLLTLSWRMVVEITKEYAGKSWNSLRQTYSAKDAQNIPSRTTVPLGQTQRYCSILGMDVRRSWSPRKLSRLLVFVMHPQLFSPGEESLQICRIIWYVLLITSPD